ncbi:hypothetical protein PilKf_02492 [Pillotina sp. SPG140]|jgi:Ca-activated chloride channel family protein
MNFNYPFIIGIGIVAIIASRFIAKLWTDAFTVPVALGPPGGIAFKNPMRLDILFNILHFIEICAVLLLFVALAEPVLQHTETVWHSRGADVLFVLDISPSMAALDRDNRSRFDNARSFIRQFIDSRPADAIGLVIVGSDAALIVAPTLDHDSLINRLSDMSIGSLGDGTALGMGLALAALHLKDSKAPRRAVVLITDGENNAGAIHPSTAASLLPEIGASLWTIGVGSSGEVPIDYRDPLTGTRRTGSFDSRFNPETLKDIATKGKGTYLEAPSSAALADAFAQIDRAEIVAVRPGIHVVTNPYHNIYISIALIMLLLNRFIRCTVLGVLL